MEHLMQMDIFFFISSIGFVILIGLMTIVLIRVIRILGSAHRVMLMIERTAGTLSDEAKDLLSDIQQSRAYTLLFGRKTARRK